MDDRGDAQAVQTACPPGGVAAAWPPWPAIVGIAAVQLIGSFGAGRDDDIARSLDVLAIMLLLAGPVLLWLTRRYVVLGAVLTIAVTFAYIARGYTMGPIVISPAMALIRIVLAERRREAWALAAAGVAAAVLGHHVAGEHSEAGPAAVAIVCFWVILVLVVADLARSRLGRRQAARMARAEQQRREASEERLRIAQELHDVLAHNISLINVQAGVGLHLLDAQPDQARAALTAIKQASKDTLGELRAVLDLLRGTDRAPRIPTGGLDEIDGLVAGVRSAALDVRIERTGTPREVPPEVDLAAYRIVQEALTNVVRHAPSATAVRVWLDHRDDSLAVHVDDDGRGEPVDDHTGTGNGLAGMRERAAALGGSFRAGRRPEGGFAVDAVLPIRGGHAVGTHAGGDEAAPA